MMRAAVGLSESFDAVEAFGEAAAEARRGLGDERCDLAVVFAGSPHIGRGKWILSEVHDVLEPAALIGCGAGGVLAAGREVEEGAGAVVWALAAPGAKIETHHLSGVQSAEGAVVDVPPDPGEALILLADPYSFPAEALLAELNASHPGTPVLGGLASAAVGGSALLLRDGDVHSEGAVACSLRGAPLLACVSQGAAPVGPEMRVTACEGNLIAELAGKPALGRLSEVIEALPERERELAAGGVMLGVVIDENRPEFERGDFLVRPIIGIDRSSGNIALGERVTIGQTVRLHVRDAASADEDLREALRAQAQALGSGGAAGALLFTCNGRGSHMFAVPDHDAGTLDDALGVPTGGFFCAGEIGPVGGRNFLHGFTATMAVFAAE
jgi:small ligand-binding sensory domain FIST